MPLPALLMMPSRARSRHSPARDGEEHRAPRPDTDTAKTATAASSTPTSPGLRLSFLHTTRQAIPPIRPPSQNRNSVSVWWTGRRKSTPSSPLHASSPVSPSVPVPVPVPNTVPNMAVLDYSYPTAGMRPGFGSLRKRNRPRENSSDSNASDNGSANAMSTAGVLVDNKHPVARTSGACPSCRDLLDDTPADVPGKTDTSAGKTDSLQQYGASSQISKYGVRSGAALAPAPLSRHPTLLRSCEIWGGRVSDRQAASQRVGGLAGSDGTASPASATSTFMAHPASALALPDGEDQGQFPAPERLHDLKHDSSVLAIAASDEYIFAGTHDGEILVWSLDTFQLVTRFQAHKRSVLCLFLTSKTPVASDVPVSDVPVSDVPVSDTPDTPDASVPALCVPPGQLLVSSAGDATISIWSPTTFQRLFEIYSTYDVGDIFSIAYSVQHETVYIGAQDTSIQWVKVTDQRRLVAHDSAHHPDKRHHRFFDSKAVGGASTPRRSDERWARIPRAQATVEVHPSAIRQFAHFGYVYSMLMARGPAHTLGADEEVLLSGGGDGTVKVWKIGPDANVDASGARVPDENGDDDSEATGGTICEVMTLGHDDGMSVLSLTLDGSFLYCGKLDGIVELWDLDTRQRLRVIKAHQGDIMTLQMNWGFLWSASADGNAAKHSTVHYGHSGAPREAVSVSQKYQCLCRWAAHGGKILASATTAHKRSRLYITGANDETVSVWRVAERCASADAEAAEEAEDVMIKNLRDFVAYKTISSRPEYAEDCHRGATFLCTLFKRLGGEVQMLQTADKAHNPVVFVKFAGKVQPLDTQRKRILFYGHYDVVAADTKKGKWTSDPFDMKGVNGYLYGRGVSDNKGPIIAALYAVTDLLQAKTLESDVIFLIEGEEESGSRGFQETVREHQDLIGPIDYILLANSYWLDDATPCLTYGLRGVLHATIGVDSPFPDLHSGVEGSHMMSEPLSDLTMVLSKLKGPRNRVMLPQFYDSVLPLRADEEARFDAIASMLIQHNPANGPADVLKASLMSRWREPNLTIHRYKVSGPDGSLVSSHACANISFRLVPGQEVDDVVTSLEAFLGAEFAQLESANRLSVHVDNKAEPWLGDPDNYIFRTLEAAIIKAWGMDEAAGPVEPEPADEAQTEVDTKADTKADAKAQTDGAESAPAPPYKARRPLYIREGGSIPAIRFLEKQFGAPAAHLPCGQASDAAHLDNERLRVVNLTKSREIFKEVFQNL